MANQPVSSADAIMSRMERLGPGGMKRPRGISRSLPIRTLPTPPVPTARPVPATPLAPRQCHNFVPFAESAIEKRLGS